MFCTIPIWFMNLVLANFANFLVLSCFITFLVEDSACRIVWEQNFAPFLLTRFNIFTKQFSNHIHSFSSLSSAEQHKQCASMWHTSLLYLCRLLPCLSLILRQAVYGFLLPDSDRPIGDFLSCFFMNLNQFLVKLCISIYFFLPHPPPMESMSLNLLTAQ